jgi:hypothetical protein
MKLHITEEQIKELYLEGKKWSLEYFEALYKYLGTKFDYSYFKSGR